MVLLTTTPTILHAISLLPNDSLPTTPSPSDQKSSSSSSTSTPPPLPTEPNAPISHTTLIQISKHLPQYTLNTLLRGTRPYHPPPPRKPSPTPEYKALMARLKADEEHRNYQRLLRDREENTLQAQGPEATGYNLAGDAEGKDYNNAADADNDDISPSLVLNILLSIVMCAAVAFHVTRYWPNDGIRVLVALGTAVLVGLAEVVVYNSYLRKKREGRRRERRKREVKMVVGEFTGEDGEAIEAWGGKRRIDGSGTTKIATETTEITQTQIWGRGVHGGMRKRVRDKWEKEQAQAAAATEELKR